MFLVYVFCLGHFGLLEAQYSQMGGCIEQALQRWYVPAASRFSQFASFTLSMPSSRHLYENLFTQTFTPNVFKEYCRNYHVGRNAYERCPNSPQKAAALAGYGLADYICIQRLEDFANALPCLQNLIPATTGSCGGQCSQYEHASRMHLNPQPQIGADTRAFMAGDCRYVKCMADCRRPVVTAQCGPQIGALVHDALHNMMASVKRQHEPIQAQVQYQSGGLGYSTFPEECHALAVAASSPHAINPWGPDVNPLVIPNPNPNAVNPYPNPNPNAINPNQQPNPNIYPPPNANPNPFPNQYPDSLDHGNRPWSIAAQFRANVVVMILSICVCLYFINRS